MTAKRNRSRTIEKSIKTIRKSAKRIRKSLKKWVPAIAALTKRYGLRSFTESLERPHYRYCVYHGAWLAHQLGHKRISVLEFGVAGGNGLANLEVHAAKIAKIFGIEIEIYGFDTGEGLPEPVDYRDLPYHWKKGFYAMDQARLKSRLKYAKLVLGDIGATTRHFAETSRPAPIAAILFDLDFYSSTKASFGVFDLPKEYYLPRIFCYFDDILGGHVELYNNYTGVRLAISEFNQSHQDKKLDKAHYLLARRVQNRWHRQIYIFHDFSHPAYNAFISPDNQQLSLQ